VELHVVFPDRVLPEQRLRTVIPAEDPFREGSLYRIFVRDEVLFAQLAPGEGDFVAFEDIGIDGSVAPTNIMTACPSP
jgi:hypothetical protein